MVNARLLLIGGLVLQAAALAVAGLANSYWVMVAMFALMGVGNTVYHPADYSLLSRHVAAERVSQAYSIHTFSGLLGSAAAPGTGTTLATRLEPLEPNSLLPFTTCTFQLRPPPSAGMAVVPEKLMVPPAWIRAQESPRLGVRPLISCTVSLPA